MATIRRKLSLAMHQSHVLLAALFFYGSVLACARFEFSTKRTPIPSVAIVDEPAAFTNDPAYDYVISGKNAKQYVWAIGKSENCDNASYSEKVAIDKPLTGRLDDGMYTLCLRGVNRRRFSEVVSYSWTVDTVAPDLAVSTADGTAAVIAITIEGTCEAELPVSFSGSGVAQETSAECSANGRFSSLVKFSVGSGSKEISITQSDKAGNISTVKRSFVKSAPPLRVNLYPMNYLSKLSFDPAERLIRLEDIPAARVISFEVFEEGLPANNFECDNLPTWAKITGSWLVFDLNLKASNGNLALNCRTTKGDLYVELDYTGSNFFHVSSSLHGTYNDAPTEPVLSPDGQWLIWLSDLAGGIARQLLGRRLDTGEVYILSSPDGITPSDGFYIDKIVISPDSSFVVFSSNAPNLGASFSASQIFRKSLTEPTALPVVLSVTADGTTVGNGSSGQPVLSSDGGFLIFNSAAPNLGATGGVAQIIKKSMTNLATAPVVVSVAADGITIANSASVSPAISADGSFVLFLSRATNFGAGGVRTQVIKKSLTNLQTAPEVVSVATDGSTLANQDCVSALISPDGTFALFESRASNLGANGAQSQIIRKSLTSLATAPIVVSVGADGSTIGIGNSTSPVLSSGGEFVIFTTSASNLGASLFVSQIVKKSLTNLVSVPQVVSVLDDGTTAGDGGSSSPFLSVDNDSVVFTSSASNMGASAHSARIFRKSLSNLAAAPDDMSLTIAGALTGNGSSNEPVLSRDGSFALFSSCAENLGSTAAADKCQIIKKSLTDLARPPEVVSVTADGTTIGNSNSQGSVISPDGSFALFTSGATNLGATANGQIVKKSLTNLASPPEVISVTNDGVTIGNGDSYEPVVSADGSFALFVSAAANLGATSHNQVVKKSLTNLATPPVVVSVTGGGTIGNGTSNSPVISADGSFALFVSGAANLGAIANNQIVKKSLTNLAAPPEVVSVAGDGTTIGDGDNHSPVISADGSFALFVSNASNLGVTVDYQIIKKSLTDLATAPVVVSVTSDGATQGVSGSSDPAISPDGTFVIFASDAANLDGYGGALIKKSLTNLATAPVALTSYLGEEVLYSAYQASISADGRYVIFTAESSAHGQVFMTLIP